MMQSVRLRSHADADGVLKLEVPVGLSDTDFEVMVIVQPIQKSAEFADVQKAKSSEELGWPPGFFEETEGSLEDDPIERPPQGDYEVREALL